MFGNGTLEMGLGNGTSVPSNKKELGLKSQFRKAEPFKEKLFSKSLRAGIKVPVPKNGGIKIPLPKRGGNKFPLPKRN